MAQNANVLATFQTRVRQLILRFQEMKKENEELYAMVADNERKIAVLEAQLAQKERDYQSLKMARMLEISDNDLKDSKERLAHLIREVNKCIAVLSDEK